MWQVVFFWLLTVSVCSLWMLCAVPAEHDTAACDSFCVALAVGISVGVVVLLVVVIGAILLWRRCHTSRPVTTQDPAAPKHTTVVSVGGDTSFAPLNPFHEYSQINFETSTPTPSPHTSTSDIHDTSDYLHLPTNPALSTLWYSPLLMLRDCCCCCLHREI